MRNKQFDERQLLARGKAYQWATLTFIFELAIWCILQEAAGFSAAPIGEFLMLLMPPWTGSPLRRVTGRRWASWAPTAQERPLSCACLAPSWSRTAAACADMTATSDGRCLFLWRRRDSNPRSPRCEF